MVKTKSIGHKKSPDKGKSVPEKCKNRHADARAKTQKSAPHEKRKKSPDMFRDLKRHFVFNSMFASTVVLIAAFSAIYILVSQFMINRKPVSVDITVEQFQPPTALTSPAPTSESAPENNMQNNSRATDQDESSESAPGNTGAAQGSEKSSENATSESAPTENHAFNENIRDYLSARLSEERDASLKTLLETLIITGLILEALIFVISLYQAEQSIRPIRKAYKDQKAFIANASHEIKTPLAVIQANLEAADIHGNHWLDNVQEKVDDITDLNNQLLALARFDSIDQEVKKTNVNIFRLTKDTADFYIPKAREKGITITVAPEGKADKKNRKSAEPHDENTKSHNESIEAQRKDMRPHNESTKSQPTNSPENAPVKTDAPTIKKHLDRSTLKQLLNILIDNAVKYGKSEIKITVSSSAIKITNDGATIAKEDLKTVFERFYQTDKSSSGVGLGLAIAKSLADRNGWKLSAASDETTTTFTVKF